MKSDTPPMNPFPTESSVSSTSGLLLLIGVAAGTVLILINIILVGCCLHRRSKRHVTGNCMPAVSAETPLN